MLEIFFAARERERAYTTALMGSSYIDLSDPLFFGGPKWQRVIRVPLVRSCFGAGGWHLLCSWSHLSAFRLANMPVKIS